MSVAHAARLRGLELVKPPGVAESLDWVRALISLGARELDPDLVASTLGVVLKYREDQEAVRARGGGGRLVAAGS